MKGTEKQIAWAEEIKANVMEIIEKAHTEMKAMPQTAAQGEMMEANVKALIDYVNGIDNAGKMIEMFKGINRSGRSSISGSFGDIVSMVQRDKFHHW